MGCRALVKSFYALLCSLGAVWVIAGEGWAQPLTGSGRMIEPVSEPPPAPGEFVRFTNGDVLSGAIEEIREGAVVMKPDMAEGSLTIPVGSVKEVVFKDREEESAFPADRVVLVNGESLGGRIEEMAEGKIVLTMPSSQRIEVDARNAAAMAFYREKEVLAEESFDSGLPEEIHFAGGQWRAQTGWLLQTDSRATDCYASLPVPQSGEVVYEWIVNTTIGRSTGLYVMASNPGLSQERAYLVRILRRYVYVYLCMNGEEVYCGSYQVSLHRNSNAVRLRCDSDRGRIELWIDGMAVGRWESSVPIKRGKYVVLRADGRAAFDDVKIVRKGGAARVGEMRDEGEGDVLTLVNGDEVTARVAGVSKTAVSFTAYNSDEVRQIGRERLLYVLFGRKSQKLPRAMDGRVVLFMRDGDRISGELLSLKEGVARIKSELAGLVELRREDVKKVIFREFP